MKNNFDSMVGKKFLISGMMIEIVSDEGDKWMTRNITTNQTVLLDKAVLEQAIRLGKAEQITGVDNAD